MLSGIPRTDKLLHIGYFNARIGRDNNKWPLANIAIYYSNGELLLALCSEFELIVTTSTRKMIEQTVGTIEESLLFP